MFVLLLILWPIAELLVAIKVAEAIGVLLTILLLAAAWPLGIALVRAEGRVALRRLGAAISAGRPPGREVLDGALVLAGGALLIIPGFITDVLGLLLLLPGTRGLARRGLVRNLHSRVVVRAGRMASGGQGYDVDSTATDLDPAHLPR
ncbi:MAG TPA: FxsA family protein [Solirubrobacteraceae bacterium]|nr:FxsA family protein [Solirubrobacteraceae bacterium]